MLKVCIFYCLYVILGLNGKTCWTTLISAFRTLVETDEDRLYIVYNGGLQLAFEVNHIMIIFKFFYLYFSNRCVFYRLFILYTQCITKLGVDQAQLEISVSY